MFKDWLIVWKLIQIYTFQTTLSFFLSWKHKKTIFIGDNLVGVCITGTCISLIPKTITPVFLLLLYYFSYWHLIFLNSQYNQLVLVLLKNCWLFWLLKLFGKNKRKERVWNKWLFLWKFVMRLFPQTDWFGGRNLFFLV